MIKPDFTIVDEAMLLLTFSGKIVINTEDNHYKFYTYVPEPNKVTFYWGRIGKTPQSLEMNTYSMNRSIYDGDKKLREKIKKGYRPLNFKESELQWKEDYVLLAIVPVVLS